MCQIANNLWYDQCRKNKKIINKTDNLFDLQISDSLEEKAILNEEKAVAYLPQINVTQKQAVRFCNGGQLGFDRLHISTPADGELFRIKFGEKFLGIGFADCEREQIGIKCIINYPE